MADSHQATAQTHVELIKQHEKPTSIQHEEDMCACMATDLTWHDTTGSENWHLKQYRNVPCLFEKDHGTLP